MVACPEREGASGRRAMLIAAMALWLAWNPTPAQAHRAGVSMAEFQQDEIALTFAIVELEGHVPLDSIDAGLIVERATIRRAVVTTEAGPCTIGPAQVGVVPKGGMEIRAPLSCPPGPRTLAARYLDAFDPAHLHTISAHGVPVGTVSPGDPPIPIPNAPSALGVAVAFLWHGAGHIAGGYDHLAFVAGLMVGARTLRALLIVITGFTLAHSVTLSLAALGWFHANPAWVEPAIAASIAWVGFENLWQPSVRRRLAITIALGLVHGLGFAGSLRELGLPRGQQLPALASFNLGVELGQVGLVLVGVGLARLMRQAWRRSTARGASETHPAEDRARRAFSIGLGLYGLVLTLRHLTG